MPIDLVQLAKLLVGTNMVRSAINGLGNGLSDAPAKSKLIAKSNGMKLTTHKIRSLDDRMKHIIGMARKGRTDPRFRAHIASVLSKKCGTTRSGDTQWCVNERDALGEVRAIFADVQQRVRYTHDIHDVDTYQTPMRTLELGISDCDDFS